MNAEGAQFEISVDGTVRSHRDVREIAFAQQAGITVPASAGAECRLGYFVNIGRFVAGGASPGAAGEITNVTQVFQPLGRSCESNSA